MPVQILTLTTGSYPVHRQSKEKSKIAFLHYSDTLKISMYFQMHSLCLNMYVNYLIFFKKKCRFLSSIFRNTDLAADVTTRNLNCCKPRRRFQCTWSKDNALRNSLVCYQVLSQTFSLSLSMVCSM